ncbi:MAG: adenosylmethionine--8-amino-7-oxononanoate transaminase [Thiotrichales bacterium]|nr:adenosylmethionine--8-amino-7-oxononanoate transaminase [Thiotrichales bacterium]
MQLDPHWQSLIDYDQRHIWHPYSASPNPTAPIGVTATQGSRLTLANGWQVVDGMSSWWAAIHGYNHPTIMQAMKNQIDTMPHIMFGGLTHEPAIELAKRLIALTPDGLEKVFFADSGSVAMEVAIKIALQYWISQGKTQKTQMLSIRQGYHGDTFATMAVCDPINGMHHLFNEVLRPSLFAPAPQMGFGIDGDNQDIAELEKILQQHHPQIAALTLEPIVQGAGGMRFYRPAYLKAARELCTQYNVLMIADEIATGFGRTGKLFACEWAKITPDIMTLGKALTGGNLTLAAVLCTDQISDTLCLGKPGVLMHGPTFMANPLACATAIASIDLLLASPWQTHIADIEQHLLTELMPLQALDGVAEVRVLGAIGVVELEKTDLGPKIQAAALEAGAWVRPFGKLIYTMPAFNIPAGELHQLTNAIKVAIQSSLCA